MKKYNITIRDCTKKELEDHLEQEIKPYLVKDFLCLEYTQDKHIFKEYITKRDKYAEEFTDYAFNYKPETVFTICQNLMKKCQLYNNMTKYVFPKKVHINEAKKLFEQERCVNCKNRLKKLTCLKRVNTPLRKTNWCNIRGRHHISDWWTYDYIEKSFDSKVWEMHCVRYDPIKKED